jgi:glycosyltransferase involved in cell wall biosynthesis
MFKNNHSSPVITIGMPIFNNALTLERAVSSIQQHVGLNFKIILSDDGSTDESWDICEQLSKSDERIIAIKQAKNLYYNNFKFVLEQAGTPYFCWLAGDDYFEEGFLTKAIDALESDPTAIAALGETMYYKKHRYIDSANGSFPILNPEMENRIISYLSAAADNSRMYGVFRTGVAKKSFPKRMFHAYDFVFSLLSLTYGKHIHIESTALHRDKTEISAYRKLMKQDGKNPVTRIFPLLSMTFYLLIHKNFPLSWPIMKELFILNFNFHLNYCDYYYPKYAGFVVNMMNQYTRLIGWRFRRFK